MGEGFLIDKVQDKTGMKGTGKWTIQQAAELSVAAPTMEAALDGRFLSGLKDERMAAEALYAGIGVSPPALGSGVDQLLLAPPLPLLTGWHRRMSSPPPRATGRVMLMLLAVGKMCARAAAAASALHCPHSRAATAAAALAVQAAVSGGVPLPPARSKDDSSSAHSISIRASSVGACGQGGQERGEWMISPWTR